MRSAVTSYRGRELARDKIAICGESKPWGPALDSGIWQEAEKGEEEQSRGITSGKPRDRQEDREVE